MVSSYAAFALQKAIDVALSADATLLALLGSGNNECIISNPVQSHPPLPYIVLGDHTSTSFDTKTRSGNETTLNLHVFSQSGDNEECSTIIDRIVTVLNYQNLTMTGQSLCLLRFDDFATIQIEDTDNLKTFHGILRFKAITQVS